MRNKLNMFWTKPKPCIKKIATFSSTLINVYLLFHWNVLYIWMCNFILNASYLGQLILVMSTFVRQSWWPSTVQGAHQAVLRSNIPSRQRTKSVQTVQCRPDAIITHSKLGWSFSAKNTVQSEHRAWSFCEIRIIHPVSSHFYTGQPYRSVQPSPVQASSAAICEYK